MENLNFFLPDEKSQHSIQNLNDLEKQYLSKSHRIVDHVAKIIGSWKFIIIQSIILSLWAILNITAWHAHWDPYPFILLNLFLSTQAAYTAPIIMMSQNRQAERDRLEAHHDYILNVKAEKEICIVLRKLETQQEKIDLLHQLLLDLNKNQKKIGNRSRPI